MKTLKSLLMGVAGLGLVAAAQPGEAEAQIKGGSVEVVGPREETNEAYGRLNLFYGLPAGIKGFSFVELYQNGDGYFGKTYLDKSLVGRIGPRVEFDHIGNPLSRIGVGLSTTIPGLPKAAWARVGILPVWFGNESDVVGDRTILQYSGGVSLPLGINVGGFADLNLTTGDGAKISYGEFEATKSFGPIKVGYNSSFTSDDFTHRAIIGITF